MIVKSFHTSMLCSTFGQVVENVCTCSGHFEDLEATLSTQFVHIGGPESKLQFQAQEAKLYTRFGYFEGLAAKLCSCFVRNCAAFVAP